MRTAPGGAARRWSNRTVVREMDRQWARWLAALVGGLLLVAAPGSVYMLCQSECLRLSYATDARRAEHERTLEEERRLQARLAELRSLEQIEAWALGPGGMVRPEADAVIVLSAPAAAGQDLLARGRVGAP